MSETAEEAVTRLDQFRRQLGPTRRRTREPVDVDEAQRMLDELALRVALIMGDQ